jgi:hypothetical protein
LGHDSPFREWRVDDNIERDELSKEKEEEKSYSIVIECV